MTPECVGQKKRMRLNEECFEAIIEKVEPYGSSKDVYEVYFYIEDVSYVNAK